MNRDVFLSLLALDAYNRGYGQGVFVQVGDNPNGQNELNRLIGKARVTAQNITPSAQAAGFYGIAYEWHDPADGELKTVISYRGTSFDGLPAGNDVLQGWTLGAGFASAGQGRLAINFYEAVTNIEPPSTIHDAGPGNTLFTGHSLGGGLAGFVASLAGADTSSAVGFDHMPFLQAAEAQAFSIAYSRALTAAINEFGSSIDLITLGSKLNQPLEKRWTH